MKLAVRKRAILPKGYVEPAMRYGDVNPRTRWTNALGCQVCPVEDTFIISEDGDRITQRRRYSDVHANGFIHLWERYRTTPRGPSLLRIHIIRYCSLLPVA